MPRSSKRTRTFREAFASLRFCGEDLDPLDITKQLRLPPDEVHRAGEPRLTRSKSGRVIEHAPFRAGVWSMSSKRWVNSPKLHLHVEWVLSQVEGKEAEIASILTDKVAGDIFCFSTGLTDRHPSIPESVRERAASFGLKINIDHYNLDDDDASPSGDLDEVLEE